MNLDKRYVFIILVIIIILSSLLRIYDLGDESLWSDEGISVDISKGTISDVIDRSNNDPKPLYYLILHFWMKLFGNSEFSVRFPSVIFGILSIYVIYKLGEFIFDTKIGLLSSIILSISLYHIRYSQEARSYSLLVLLVLLSNYYFVKFLENKDERKYITGDERKHITGYVLSSIAMIYTHFFGLFYIVFQNIYYLAFQRKDIKSWMIIQGIILSFFMLWLPFLLKKIDISIETRMVAHHLPIPTLNSVYSTLKIFTGDEQILYLFIIVIIVGLLISTIKYNKKDIEKYIFMMLWIFLPIIISIIISYTIGSIYANRYFIASFPPLILLFSKGIFNIRKIPIILPIILIVIVLQVSILGGYYNDIQKEQWRDTANYIKNNKDTNDMILLYPGFTKITFDYYYKNDSDHIKINDSNYVRINNASDVKKIVDDNDNNNDRVWLISSHITYRQRSKGLELIEKELSNKFVKKDIITFTGIKIYLYKRIKKGDNND